MVFRHNGASRLRHIFEGAERCYTRADDSIRAYQVWARVLSLDRRELDDQQVYFAVVDKVRLLRTLIDDVVAQLESLEDSPNGVAKHANRLRQTINPRFLNDQWWSKHKNCLSEEVMHDLERWPQYLPAEERGFTVEDVNETLDGLKDFHSWVASEADLPDVIRDFLLKQIDCMRQALEDSVILGAEALAEGVQDVQAAVYRHYDDISEHSDNEDVREAVKTLGEYLETVFSWIEYGEKAVKYLPALMEVPTSVAELLQGTNLLGS